MATVNEYVIDILEEIVVQEDEAPIESSEGQAVIRFLNDRMFAWDAMGISLGYTEVDSLDDVVTVAPGSAMGIKAQVAIDIANKYNYDVKSGTVSRAEEGLRAIMNLAELDAGSMEYPDTLPKGSGNYSTEDIFYSDLESTILTETGGSIALETDTEEE